MAQKKLIYFDLYNARKKFLYHFSLCARHKMGFEWLIAIDDFSALSLCILVAFRYMVQYVIYIVLIGVVVACIGGTTYLW